MKSRLTHLPTNALGNVDSSNSMVGLVSSHPIKEQDVAIVDIMENIMNNTQNKIFHNPRYDVSVPTMLVPLLTDRVYHVHNTFKVKKLNLKFKRRFFPFIHLSS